MTTALCVLSFAAQLQVATLRGIVVDTEQQPVSAAHVVLQDSAGAAVALADTRADGSFDIADVVPGAYVLRVHVGGVAVLSQPLVVRGSLPIQLTLRTGPAVREDIVVRGDAGSNTTERPWSLSAESLRRVTEPIPSQRVQSTLASLPGWMSEDNGLLHVRGVDDGILFVQDGIPIYERLDRLFGLPPETSSVASMHVLDGYIPPEFGLKSGGVVEVRTLSGLQSPWSGTIDAGAATAATRYVNGIASGPVGRGGGLMFAASHERSSRFLDPVDTANFHNSGGSTSGSAQASWRTAADLFTATLQGGHDRYDVPHSLEQEDAGQDQRQRISQLLATATWQRIASDRTAWQGSIYHRGSSSTLHPSAHDTPVTADAHRRNNRAGALWSLTHQRNRHTLKFGFEASRLLLDERFSFAVTDPIEGADAGLSDAAIAHTIDNPFVFADRTRPWLWSIFAQDVFRLSDRLTANFGARFDRTNMLTPASQVSPRAGASYRVRPGTTVRGSFLRLFQPPQSEYLLLASSEAARELSPLSGSDIGGGSSLPPERQSAFDVSVSQDLHGAFGLDGGVWRRRARDVGDPNVFFGTTVTVPNSVARQDAWGVAVRLEMRPRRGWTALASYSYARVVQFGPITGGLFLEDDVLAIADGTKFVPDHDQRHAVFATATYADEQRRWRVSAAFRYQTGTPVGLDEDDVEEVRDRRDAEVVDFSTGRVRPRATLDAQGDWTMHRGARADLAWTAWMTNVTNQTYAFNFGNPFSGTHFGSPRRAGLSVRITIANR